MRAARRLWEWQEDQIGQEAQSRAITQEDQALDQQEGCQEAEIKGLLEAMLGDRADNPVQGLKQLVFSVEAAWVEAKLEAELTVDTGQTIWQ